MANNTENWSGEPEPNTFLLGEDRSTQPGFVRQNRRQSVNDQGNDVDFAKTIKDEHIFGPATALGPYWYEATKLNATRDQVVLGREVTILSGRL